MTRGFTLTEMVVVLAILGITAAAVIPALTRIEPEIGEARTARRLEQVLNAARALALEQAATIEVALVPENARYWVRIGASPAVDSGMIEMEDGVRLTSTAARPRFRFAPAGSAVGDSVVVLGPSAAITVAVDAWTGGVRAITP